MTALDHEVGINWLQSRRVVLLHEYLWREMYCWWRGNWCHHTVTHVWSMWLEWWLLPDLWLRVVHSVWHGVHVHGCLLWLRCEHCLWTVLSLCVRLIVVELDWPRRLGRHVVWSLHSWICMCWEKIIY